MPAMKMPSTFNTGEPSYLMTASTPGSVSPTLLTMSKAHVTLVLNFLGVNPLRLPLLYLIAVDPVLAVLSLFLLDARLVFFALLATVAHLLALKGFSHRNLCRKVS